jgi:RNA polymerase sigma factor (sigma-70 family)
MNQDERFEGLYRQYYSRVLHFLIKNFRFARDDASDIAQDIFLRVFAVADQYPEDREWHFIETIARNVVMNRLRDLHTTRRTDISTWLIELTDSVTNAPNEPPPQEKAVAAAELSTQLYEAINALPAELRTALFLQLSEFTFVEIAQALRVTLPAVKARLNAARRRLRELLPRDQIARDLVASADYTNVVPLFARQKLSTASSVSSTASLEDATRGLLDKAEALAAQQQHLSRQMDEYERMLARYQGTITNAASAKQKMRLS